MAHGVEGRARRSRLSAQDASQVAETMQALATPSRLRILDHLRDGPAAVGDLAEAIEMEQSAVSQQLRVLRHLGLVIGQRAGQRVIYALHDDHIAALLEEAIFHTEHLRLGQPNPIHRREETAS